MIAAPTIRPEPARTVTRLHGLDHLRAFAMFLGVVLHAVLPYITEPAADAWPARNDQKSLGFDLVAGIIHSFRMQLFFLLSGFFARLVHERVGPAGFLKHRLLRIGLPFAVGLVTIVPIVRWQWNGFLSSGATIHLWFLEYLLVYSLASLVLARFSPGPSVNRGTRWLLASPWKPWLLALPTALLMLWSPIWDEIKNARGTTFLPNLPALIYYSLFFLFGWALHKHADLLEAFKRGAVWQFALGFVSLIAWGLLHKSNSPLKEHFILYYVTGSSIAWLFSFAMIALFLRHFDSPSPLGRYLADSAYWIYLAHMPVVIGLQQWLVPSRLPPWIEFAAINLLALAILLPSYEYLVRYTIIGAVLNGRKTRLTSAT